MERNSFWIFIAIAVAFGGAMEAMKGGGTGKPRKELVRFEDIEDAGPVDGHDARAGRIRGAVREAEAETVHVAGMTMVTPSLPNTDANAAAPGQPKAQTKVAKKDDKKNAKKKKKKKKKIEGKETELAKPTDSDPSDEPEEKPEAAAASPETPIAMGAGAIRPQQTDNGIPESQRDWEILILAEPNFKAVEKLIKFYNSRMVTQDIFYNVIRQMLDDSRPKMRQLGVVALGATPSARSFTELTKVVQEETGVTPMKTQAQNYMNRYTEIAYVRFLGAVLQTNSSPFTSLEAMRILRVAIDRHLKPLQARLPAEEGQEDQSSQTPTQTPAQEAAQTAQQKKQAAMLNYFRPFIALLTRLQATYTQSDLKQAANLTLSTLNTLIPAQEAPAPALNSQVLPAYQPSISRGR